MEKEIEILIDEFRRYNVISLKNKENSVNKYIVDIKFFLNNVGKKIDLINLDDIESYLDSLNIVYKNSTNTQRRKRAAIRLFFGWRSKRYHKPNPAELIPPMREEIKLPIMPTPDEFKRMVVMCNNGTKIGRRDAAVLCLLSDTGIRLSECVALNLKDVEVHDKNYLLRVPAIKSDARFVPFGKLVKKKLIAENFSAYYSEIRFTDNYDIDGPLFKQMGRYYKDERLGPHGIRYIVSKYTKLAEINKHITPHSFRHWFGTYSILNGTKESKLKELMGHRWLETTMRYVHISEAISGSSLDTRGTTNMESEDNLVGFEKIIKDAVTTGII